MCTEKWCDFKLNLIPPCCAEVCVFSFSSFVLPAIKEKYTDWTEFLIRDLTGSRTAPASLLEGVCIVVIHYSVSEASRLREHLCLYPSVGIRVHVDISVQTA